MCRLSSPPTADSDIPVIDRAERDMEVLPEDALGPAPNQFTLGIFFVMRRFAADPQGPCLCRTRTIPPASGKVQYSPPVAQNQRLRRIHVGQVSCFLLHRGQNSLQKSCPRLEQPLTCDEHTYIRCSNTIAKTKMPVNFYVVSDVKQTSPRPTTEHPTLHGARSAYKPGLPLPAMPAGHCA